MCFFFYIPLFHFLANFTNGQSEPTATNASIGHFVHWMGCIFSFDTKWGSSQSISFCYWPLYFYFFWFLVGFPLDLTSHFTHLPTFINIAPTLVPYLLSLINIATLITSYHIDLTTILTTYPTNLITLLITTLLT